MLFLTLEIGRNIFASARKQPLSVSYCLEQMNKNFVWNSTQYLVRLCRSL